MTNFKKTELLKYYGLTYLIIAILETILFTLIKGDYSFRGIVLIFSIWGIIWLISMFAYPAIITSVDPATLQLSKWFALLGYVIIIVGYIIAFNLHKRNVEKRIQKDLSFSNLLDLYFPIRKQN